MIDRYIARADYLLWSLVLFVGIENEFGFFAPLIDGRLEKIDDALIKAASIIVSFTIGFLINKHFDAKKIRREKLSEFQKSQKRLVMYLEAFLQLRVELSHHYTHLKPEFSADYRTYKMAIFGKETPAQDAFANSILNCLMNLSKYYLKYSIGFHKDMLLTKADLADIEYMLSDLSGFFVDSGTCRAFIEDLKLGPETYIEDVVVTQRPSILSARATAIVTKEADPNFGLLEFWLNKFEEANALANELLELTRYLHDYRNRVEQRILSCLLNVSVYGILTPLTLIAFNWPIILHKYLSLVSLLLFAWNFIKVLNILKKEIRETSIDI